MKKLLLVFAIASILLVGCSPSTPEPIVVTATPEPATDTPEARPTNTPVPTPTPPPATATPEPTETPDTSEMFALNYLASAEKEGVSVEVVRVLFGSAEAVSAMQDVSVEAWSEVGINAPAWTDMDLIGEVIIRYTNNRDEPVELAFGGCGENLILISGQQINFNDVSLPAGSNNLCHDPLYPQASVIQGVWFPINNLSLKEISSATLILECAEELEEYRCIGSDWNIELDLSDQRWEELPEELQ